MTARKHLLAWLPAVLWMAVLFSASTELGASRRTSRILIPVLRWLVPDIAPATLDRAQFFVRKSGHAFGYAVLAALLWRARHLTAPAGTSRFAREASFAFVAAAAFAASDEWHQTFTLSRQGSTADVALDAAGAAGGLAMVWLARRCWNLRAKRPVPLQD